jgi:GTP1/Obg family GTP-binding protein
MDQLIQVVGKLHDVLQLAGDYKVALPAVVAIGMQSSGKSSVLENIVGRYVHTPV